MAHNITKAAKRELIKKITELSIVLNDRKLTLADVVKLQCFSSFKEYRKNHKGNPVLSFRVARQEVDNVFTLQVYLGKSHYSNIIFTLDRISDVVTLKTQEIIKYKKYLFFSLENVIPVPLKDIEGRIIIKFFKDVIAFHKVIDEMKTN